MAELVYNVRDVRTIRELFETTVQEHSDKVAFLYRSGEAVREGHIRRGVCGCQGFGNVSELARTERQKNSAYGQKIVTIGR